MLYSMTGYGSDKFTIFNTGYEIIITSLNSKNIDINIRTPQSLKSLEIDIRNLLANKLIRGKVDLYINYDMQKGSPTPTLNEDVLYGYLNQINNFSFKYQINEMENPLATLIKLPGVFEIDKNKLTDAEVEIINKSIENAINQVIEYRKQEGEKTQKDISDKINIIKINTEKIIALKEERDKKIREDLINLTKQLPDNIEIDHNRLEQEILYYLDRLDINEELQRLTAHLSYFEKELQDNINLSKGKKLAFISQEILREVNTLGNKSNYLAIQQIIVNIKDDIEKIKEQLSNVL
ncbi:MAG TPA: YicC family protein [Bacteroidales bacterium]|nr:YicC family protein [Bacteroidales bacterium]HOB27726.1 YicC family protein [Bacteroidales bacterium]HPU47479.1 YicC family protein [Bacteroidales bacterium]HPZ36693.1 YicC family protein [Bacteroidales bacterium]HQD35014.1 YicC family protein [Bacteroidales bacterium]